MKKRPFRLIAPPHTPFRSDLSLDLDVVPQQLRLLENEVDGVFVAGSTGEGQSLTTAERVALAECWVDASAAAKLEVIVQVGHNSLSEAAALAAHAERIGADAIAASAPCYFKPARVQELIDYLAGIASAAPDLPFYFYDIPHLTGVRLSMVELLGSVERRIPNLAGLKYSNTDLVQLLQCLQFRQDGFEILYGSDETLLSAAVLGVDGAVGTTYNFAAPLYRQMVAACYDGDLATARAAQLRSVEMIQAVLPHGIAGFKAMMGMFGVECGPVRPPLRNLTLEEKRLLHRKLEELGFLEARHVPPRSAEKSASDGQAAAPVQAERLP